MGKTMGGKYVSNVGVHCIGAKERKALAAKQVNPIKKNT